MVFYGKGKDIRKMFDSFKARLDMGVAVADDAVLILQNEDMLGVVWILLKRYEYVDGKASKLGVNTAKGKSNDCLNRNWVWL